MRLASAIAAPAARLPPLPLWLAVHALSRKCGSATFLDPRGGRSALAGLGALRTIDWGAESSFQAAFALLATGCLFSSVWFLRRDDTAQAAEMGRHESTVDNQ